MADVRCIASLKMILGEGPVWVEREAALYWVDIKGRKIFRLNEHREQEEWQTPFRVGSISPTESGGFIAGTDQGLVLIDLDPFKFEIVANPEAGIPNNRFNDGKIDRAGRLWTGTMDNCERQSTGTLYRVEPDFRCTAIDQGYHVTNGPAFSPSGDRLYENDSGRQVTYLFDLDPEGVATNRRAFLQFGKGDGHPDGMTVDAEGCLWIAFWDGWCLRRYSPDAELIETIQMPVARPTSCAFGGPNLDRLYVTSASRDLDEAALAMQPNAGGLFMLSPGVRGLADVPFKGG